MTLLDRLRDAAPPVRATALLELAERPSMPSQDEMDAVLAALRDERKLVQRRAADALAQLAARGVEVRSALEAAVCSGPWRERWGAAYALSRLGAPPPAAVDALVEGLAVADGDLRWAAAECLRRVARADPDPVIARLLRLADDGVPPARKMALYCLRDLGEPRAADVAEAALSAPAVEVRLAGLAAFARVTADRAAAARRIAALLDDPDPRLRRAAAGTLGTLGERAAEIVAALEKAARSPDAALSRAAARSLRLLSAAVV